MLVLHNLVAVEVFQGAESVFALKITISSIQNYNFDKDWLAGFQWQKTEKA